MGVFNTNAAMGVIFVIIAAAHGEETFSSTVCKSNADCASDYGCHAVLGVCFRKSQLPPDNAGVTMATNCVCKPSEYCHTVFNRCLPKLVPPVPPQNSNRARIPSCSTNTDCRDGEYCHEVFKMCLQHLKIPTTAGPRARSLRPCHDDSVCAANEYCHVMFKFCLVAPTGLQTPTTPKPTAGCLRNSECQSGQYCHGVLHMCLYVHNVSNDAVPRKRLLSRFCSSDSDCRPSEYCLFRRARQSSAVARHRRLRCGNVSNCARSQPNGMCTRRRVSPRMGCDAESDCGAGVFCLRTLRTCMRYRQKGELCLVQSVAFVSACAPGLICKPTPKAKILKGKRLERKLRLPKYIRKMTLVRNLVKKKHALGRCQDDTNT